MTRYLGAIIILDTRSDLRQTTNTMTNTAARTARTAPEQTSYMIARAALDSAATASRREGSAHGSRTRGRGRARCAV